MNKINWQRLSPHIIAAAIFLIVSIIYCKPALQGKVLQQSDVLQWKGMAAQSFKYKETHGHFPLWTNSMFCGMPAFQIAMDVANPIAVGYLHYVCTLFLSKPFVFFFLMCISFYFLSQVLKVDYRIGILGALAYAYASYSEIIVITGHDTKALTMGYMPAVLGAFLLVFQKRYWIGAALSVVFTSLFIGMNHPQIVYYFLIITACLLTAYIIYWLRNKEYKHLLITLAILAFAAIIGVGTNLVPLATTYDYSKATMRGGTALDTANTNEPGNSGLSIDYAFQWSYGTAETFTLLVPNVYGGGSSTKLGSNSHLAKLAIDKGVPDDQAAEFASYFSQFAYWGAQPFTSGPVYVGAVICFLFLFGMIYLKTFDRWWALAACAIAIMMSWGKNFEVFNAFLFNYLPLYNKFRAPTMALVIPQFLFPFISILALQEFVFNERDKNFAWKKLKLTGLVTLGIFVLAGMMYLSFDYKGANDASIQNSLTQLTQGNKEDVNAFYNALKQDRQSLFSKDLLRSLFFAGAAFLFLWLISSKKIKTSYGLIAIVLLSSIDVLAEGRRYLNDNSFAVREDAESVKNPSPADLEILKDTGYYRVLNLTTDAFQDAITSYHHNAVGGYSPAKLSIVQDLLNYQLNKQPMNVQVLNMLNTKYFIVPGQQNQPMVQQNPQVLGACWFVKAVQFVKDPAAAMKALNTLNPADTAIVEEAYKSNVPFLPVPDSTAQIRLIKNDNDVVTYQTNSKTNQFAVFSEIFYDRGWKAYIDNKETPVAKTNYVLRGLAVPAGNHEIRFEFKPASYYNSLTIAIISSALAWLAIAAAIWQALRKKRRDASTGKTAPPVK